VYDRYKPRKHNWRLMLIAFLIALTVWAYARKERLAQDVDGVTIQHEKNPLDRP